MSPSIYMVYQLKGAFPLVCIPSERPHLEEQRMLLKFILSLTYRI